MNTLFDTKIKTIFDCMKVMLAQLMRFVDKGDANNTDCMLSFI